MSWFFLSLACAFFSATLAVIFKLALKKRDELSLVWLMFAFALPILLGAFLLAPIPRLGGLFWKTVAIMLPVEITAFLMYMRALKISPLSLVFPFLGLTPVFAILTSSVLLHEKLSLSGISGVIFVTAGAYLLNIRSMKDGALVPIKNICREKGVLLMIIVAFFYSFTSALGKKAVLLSNPQSFPVVYYGMFFAILTPIVLARAFRYRRSFRGDFEKKDILLILAAGVLFATAVLFHYKAISLAKVSYMISVKRLSLVISVLYGAIIFKEKNIGYRIFGSSIMVLGVLILALAK
ncbi:MAG: DMT family transporter [Candidatus Omnitrophica bacterium]|nr:DMT family transporter [Candidatus Omnitrophota bacterium]